MSGKRALIILPPSESGTLCHQPQLSEWEFLQVKDSQMARRIVMEQDIRVGLVYWHGETPDAISEWIERLNEDLVLPGLQVQWIALMRPYHTEYCEARQFIAEKFFDYHTLPLDLERLGVILGHAYGMACLASLNHPIGLNRQGPSTREGLAQEGNEFGMIGSSNGMQVLFGEIRKAASASAPVLIRGETGTGKELAALAIHKSSDRAQGPFVALNCACLPANLIEAELFGYEKGAFTGAHQRKLGRIELAQGGTIFLDEIGDLPTDLQVHLLRFLEEMNITRVGGTATIPVGARVISATHVNLEESVEAGRFREDLYFRLNVLELVTPPLRDRGDDIASIAEFYLAKFCEENRSEHKRLSNCALHAMRCHHWPGNVRELRNRVRRATIMGEGRVIRAADLGLPMNLTESRLLTLEEARANAEKQALGEALRRSSYNLTRTASALGISRRSAYRLLERHGLRESSSRCIPLRTVPDLGLDSAYPKMA